MIPYVFHDEAEAEFASAALFYESRTEGLGSAFVHAVERTVALIREYPDAGFPIDGLRRRMMVAGFPDVVVYRHEAGLIIILAVAHVRQRPAYWRVRE